MGTYYHVDATGNVVAAGTATIASSCYAQTFDTNVAAAHLEMTAALLRAVGTDADIDVTLTPKGTGSVVMSKADINSGTIDSTVIGGATPAAGDFTTLVGTVVNATTSFQAPMVYLDDSDASNTLRVTWAENDIANRTLALNVNAGSWSLNIFGNSTIDQSVAIAGSPEFAGLTLTGFAGIVQAVGGVLSASVLDLDDFIDGATYGKVLLTSLTVNEVTKLTDAAGDDLTIALNGSDRVLDLDTQATIYLDQNLRTTDTPTFAGINFNTLTLGGAGIGDDLITLQAYTTLSAPVAGGGNTGVDDITLGVSAYTGAANAAYDVEIFAGDPTNPNTYQWRKDAGAWNDNGGAGYPVAITPTIIEEGISVTFGAVTGHVTGDTWAIAATAYTGNFWQATDIAGTPLYYLDNIGALIIASATISGLMSAGSATITGAVSTGALTATSTASVASTLTANGRLITTQDTDVVSANDITLGDGNYFDITGVVEVQRILGTDWIAGSVIALQTDGSPNIKDGVAAGGGYYGFKLAAGADFLMSAGATLVVIFDGAWFREISRTVV